MTTVRLTVAQALVRAARRGVAARAADLAHFAFRTGFRARIPP